MPTTRPQTGLLAPSIATGDPPATIGWTGDIAWLRSDGLVDYVGAVRFMEQRVEAIHRGDAPQCVWLLEHPPVYTAGTSARPEEWLGRNGIAVHQTGRGGRYTYHGPGQRVAYVMLDLRRHGSDVRAFVAALERWLIGSLAGLGVEAGTRAGRIGVWVTLAGGREAKIAALGIRVRRWISYHGIAVNVCPDLAHFSGIVPCGLAEHAVTSLAALGVAVPLTELDRRLMSVFPTAIAPLAASSAGGGPPA